MAFNQVSLILYPPRWKRHSIADVRMKHSSCEPLRIVSAVPAEEGGGPVVRFDDLCRWFEGKGFEAIARRTDFGRFCTAEVESAPGPQAEIDVSISAKVDEVTSLYCRLLLTRETPFRLEHWEAFIQELCGTFALRISVSDTESVGPEKFLTVVRQTDNWRSFADHFGWSEPST